MLFFFKYDSKFKIKKKFWWGRGERGGGARVSDFFYKESKCIKKK